MRRPRARAGKLAAVAAATAMLTAACGASGITTTADTTSGPSGTPITVGISLPLTGAFRADGQASERGYELWASDVNTHGGLLGRPVKLVILDDKSSTTTVAQNYTQLITADKVDLTLGPFSSLLTIPAANVAAKYGYAFPEGSGGAPLVFQQGQNKKGLRNLFDPSAPVVDQLVPFADWVKSLPASQRPKTAAYPMVSDPFADPPVQAAQKILEKAGVRTVYSHEAYTKTGNQALQAYAAQVAATGAQIVMLGSVSVGTVADFIKEFATKGYNPRMFIATSGPDQGQNFLSAVGTNNAIGIMVPNGWYGGFPDPLSHVMVQDYIAKYGGTASQINADVAEAYSAGELLADGVSGTKSLNNSSIISYLHTHTFETVQGKAQFASDGSNKIYTTFIFQWQSGPAGDRFLQVLPTGAGTVTKIDPSKPKWAP